MTIGRYNVEPGGVSVGTSFTKCAYQGANRSTSPRKAMAASDDSSRMHMTETAENVTEEVVRLVFYFPLPWPEQATPTCGLAPSLHPWSDRYQGVSECVTIYVLPSIVPQKHRDIKLVHDAGSISWKSAPLGTLKIMKTS